MLTSTVCIALSAAGLAVALLTAYRRRYRAALRIAALALLPVGLYMAGLITLAGEVGTAAADWASGLVLEPSVWAGFGVLAVAAALFASTRFGAGRRAEARAERRAAKSAGAGKRAGAVAPAASAPALPKPAEQPKGGRNSGDDLSDFSDIEEILKRRGI